MLGLIWRHVGGVCVTYCGKRRPVSNISNIGTCVAGAMVSLNGRSTLSFE